jgi:tetratricopeptide (TPR) repeat protein
LGELYAGTGDVELAEQYFRASNTEYATIALAQLKASEGNWEEVIELLEDLQSTAAKSLLQTARASIENKIISPYVATDMGYQMDDAWLEEVEAMCVLAPLLVTHAQTDFIVGDIDTAEQLLRKAIVIDQSNKDARLALANILLRADRLSADSLDEALLHLEAGIESDPDYVMTRAKYGWALYLAKRFNEARNVWSAVLLEEPLHGPVLTNLAQLEYLHKNYQKAYDYYIQAFSVPEDSPFAISNSKELRSATLYRFALVAKQINRADDAIEALQLAVEYSPSNADAQFELGNTYIGRKNFTEALSQIEIANALRPHDPRILAALGYTWFHLENNQFAIEFLTQSVQKAPTFALAWYHLGNAQIKQGDLQGAKESFSIALRLQPTFTLAKEALLGLEGR